MKDLLTLLDLSKEHMLDILNLADQLKYENENKIPHRYLKDKVLGMIFEKSSTRTRVSFEVGMLQLGGHALFLSSRDIQLGRGESIKDTARVLERYIDGIMIRTFAQSDVEELASNCSIPVINGLTDSFHPCQVLADLMTIREQKGTFQNLKICFIGDTNNMANSLIVGALKMGMDFTLATARGYSLDPRVLEFTKSYSDFHITNDIFEAAKEADVLYTDVWASMGQETERAKREIDFKGFIIDSKLMSIAKPDAIVLHCLPAHKGEEISEEIFEKHAKVIFDEAENRLHAQKAVMVKLMAKGGFN